MEGTVSWWTAAEMLLLALENPAAKPFYPGSGAKPSHIQGIQFAGWRCGIQAGYYGDLSRHLPLTRDLDRKNHIKALPKGQEDPG